MEIKEIKESPCSVCGARVISESVRHIHCNGSGFEEREFECGRKLAFIPNFMRVEVKKECHKSPSEKDKRKKREDAVKKILNYVRKLDADDDWKNEICSSIERYWIR